MKVIFSDAYHDNHLSLFIDMFSPPCALIQWLAQTHQMIWWNRESAPGPVQAQGNSSGCCRLQGLDMLLPALPNGSVDPALIKPSLDFCTNTSIKMGT